MWDSTLGKKVVEDTQLTIVLRDPKTGIAPLRYSEPTEIDMPPRKARLKRRMN